MAGPDGEDLENVVAHKLAAAAALVIKQNPLLLDKVYTSLQDSLIILEDFTQFPHLEHHNG